MDEERTLMAQLIGEYIVSTRRDKHIRQYALAVKADIPQRTLRTLEKGEVDISVYQLSKIVQALDEDMQSFWEELQKDMKVREQTAAGCCRCLQKRIEIVKQNQVHEKNSKTLLQSLAGGYIYAIIFY